PAMDQDLWAPSGMDALGPALEWASFAVGKHGRDGWLLQLGCWLASRGRIDDALAHLAASGDDRARALAGRLHLKIRNDPRGAIDAFRAIANPAFGLHPQVVVERDVALAALGDETLAERERWLAAVNNSQDEWLIERKAAFLLDQGKAAKARAL